MSRAQVRSSVRWKAVIIALFGTALGLGIGVFFGWATVRALSDKGITRLTVRVADCWWSPPVRSWPACWRPWSPPGARLASMC